MKKIILVTLIFITKFSVAQDSLIGKIKITNQICCVKTITINHRTGKDVYVYRVGFRKASLIKSNNLLKVDSSFNYAYTFDSNLNGRGIRCYNIDSNKTTIFIE